jgi:hypothetical protein
VTQDKFSVFSSKHQSLKDLVDPVYERYHESSRREKEVDRCENLFNQTRTLIEQTRRNNDWIPELELDEVFQQTRETEQWVRSTLDKQGRTPLSEPPVALASEIKEKCAKPLAGAIKLFKRPKPKVETIKNETATAEPTKNETTPEEQPKEEKQNPKDEL